jgi:hypothetical protein
MIDDTPLPFDLPAVCRKKLRVDFDGGNQSSDAGLLLLREAECSMEGDLVVGFLPAVCFALIWKNRG